MKNPLLKVLFSAVCLFPFSPVHAQQLNVSQEDKETVNHLDEDKTNNRVDNLEWATMKENCNYGTHTERVVSHKRHPVYLLETNTIYKSLAEAARQTGINVSTICNNLSLPDEKKRKWHNCY